MGHTSVINNTCLLQSIFIRYNMNMFGMFGQRDQLTLSNAPMYLEGNSIDPFVYFVNNVSIKTELTYFEETSLEKFQEALGKALQVFGIKLLAPLRTLAMRFLQGNHGFLELHIAYLSVCRILHAPAEALPILEYPGMFKHLRKAGQIDFMLLACDIYIELRRYNVAYEWALRASKVEGKDERLASAAKRLVILSIYMGKPLREINDVTSRAYTLLEHSVAMMSDQAPLGKREKDWQKERFLREQALTIFRIILGIKEWRKLSEDEERVLQHEGLLDVYRESQYSSLRSYIQSDVKGLNWRIRASEVKGQQVGKIEVARGVNQPKEVYKFDSQDRLMYFNHRACDQQQLNELITQAFLMQNEVNNCKIERKEVDQFGRMGGMLGMMGGMGGMGGFGFGGMGSSKKRRGGDRGDMFDYD